MKFLFVFLFAIAICHSNVNAQVMIKVEDINKHIGDSVKICTKIYGGNYYNRKLNTPTYLYVGNDYPNNPLTIFISKQNRDNFEDRPEMMYAYKNVCITGKLELDKDKPILIVAKPEQIVIQD